MTPVPSPINLLDDESLCETFLAPIRRCAAYRPAFGRSRSGAAVSGFTGFLDLYSADPFYHWIGLDNELVYAAHKAAGGMTSLYRQIGVGAELLFRSVLRGAFGLDEASLAWGYDYEKDDRTTGRHTLDALLRTGDLDGTAAARVGAWIEAATLSGGRARAVAPCDAVVFEIRQGYKSADSKRQNADLRFGMRAYRDGILPALAVLSSQVSEPVVQRYRRDGLVVLTGTPSPDPAVSTFAFMDQVVDYDLAAFFARNSDLFRAEVQAVADALLRAE